MNIQGQMVEPPHNDGRLGLSGLLQIELDAQGIAEVAELHALLRKHGEQRKREAAEAGRPVPPFEIGTVLKPDLSQLSEQEREDVENEIAKIRADPAFRAQLKKRLAKSDPDLACLMDVDDAAAAEGEGTDHG